MAQDVKPATQDEASSDATALWYVAPRECALNAVSLPAEHERMRAPFQDGEFPFPVKYGYCAVGRVEAGPEDSLGQIVFCLHPHQDVFVAPADRLAPVPDDVPPRRAILAANMETALNAHWDAASGPGDRIVIVGGGVLGLLVAWLAARLPGTEVTLVDVDPRRATLAAHLGFGFALPDEAPAEADLVFHASASAGGLATAIAAAGLEARIVELSWYGQGTVAAPLGGAFHSRRLQLVSSQVGQVSPSRRARWDYARRSRAAMALLADARLDALITHTIPFREAATRLPALLAPEASGLTAAIDYGELR